MIDEQFNGNNSTVKALQFGQMLLTWLTLHSAYSNSQLEYQKKSASAEILHTIFFTLYLSISVCRDRTGCYENLSQTDQKILFGRKLIASERYKFILIRERECSNWNWHSLNMILYKGERDVTHRIIHWMFAHRNSNRGWMLLLRFMRMYYACDIKHMAQYNSNGCCV